jgi:hypothetical protein
VQVTEEVRVVLELLVKVTEAEQVLVLSMELAVAVALVTAVQPVVETVVVLEA